MKWRKIVRGQVLKGTLFISFYTKVTLSDPDQITLCFVLMEARLKSSYAQKTLSTFTCEWSIFGEVLKLKIGGKAPIYRKIPWAFSQLCEYSDFVEELQRGETWGNRGKNHFSNFCDRGHTDSEQKLLLTRRNWETH